jgi:DNA-binding MarR family transcriptional regulator
MRRLEADVCLHDREASQRLRLSDTASRVLTLLAVHGPLSPGHLATLTGLTTGGVTTVIDRLDLLHAALRHRDVTELAIIARFLTEMADGRHRGSEPR